MHTPFSRFTRSLCGLLVVASLFLFGGCLEERLVWSPDGQHAAVLAKDGLRLCSPDGALAEPIVPGATLAIWFADSQRLLVAREREATGWPEVAASLPSSRLRQIEAAASTLWSRIQQGTPWAAATKEIDGDRQLVLACLREKYAAELASHLAPDQQAELAQQTISLAEVMLVRLRDGSAELDPPLLTFTTPAETSLTQLRLAPDEKAVAVSVPEDTKNRHFRIVVATLDPGPAPAVVATDAAAYPDWTTDGRALVYLHAATTAQDDLPQFATFQQREVRDSSGALALAESTTDLGGAIFQPFCRVRCLRDGRIVFNAAELSLPVAARDLDTEREYLFAFDPGRQSTLVRLSPRTNSEKFPQLLGFFEPSADGTQLLIGGVEGEVCVFTLATGEVEQVQPAGKGDIWLCQPAWRGPGEFSYVRRTTAVNGQAPERPFEVVLRRGDRETVLSAGWSDEMIKSLE